MYLFKQKIAKREGLGQFNAANIKPARKSKLSSSNASARRDDNDTSQDNIVVSSSGLNTSSSVSAVAAAAEATAHNMTEDRLANRLVQLSQKATLNSLKSSQHIPFIETQESSSITVDDVLSCLSRYAYNRGGGKCSHIVGRCVQLAKLGIYKGVYQAYLRSVDPQQQQLQSSLHQQTQSSAAAGYSSHGAPVIHQQA